MKPNRLSNKQQGFIGHRHLLRGLMRPMLLPLALCSWLLSLTHHSSPAWGYICYIKGTFRVTLRLGSRPEQSASGRDGYGGQGVFGIKTGHTC